MSALTYQQWEARGSYRLVGKHRLFYYDSGDATKPALLILHGYPSCSFDYWRVLPLLEPHFRVIVHDQLGFGLSDKPLDYSYSLIDQADMALLFWQEIGIGEGHLLAHDYGTSVATEIIARRNFGCEPVRLLSATLGNGSMLIHLARLFWSQRLLKHPWFGPPFARLATRRLFLRNMTRLWSDPRKADRHDLLQLWELLLRNGGRRVLPALTRYIDERFRFWHRWIGGLKSTDLHINILWAADDPIAVVEMAHHLHRLIPHNSLCILDQLGHYPMLEDPPRWAAHLLDLVRSLNFDN